MHTPKLSWLALSMVFFLAGCPNGDEGGGIGEAGSGAIVYLADQTTPGVFELFLVSSGTKLNPSLQNNRTVTNFSLTPDKTAVVYVADQNTDDVFELFRVNLANPGVSQKLNGSIIPVAGDVTSFVITRDGNSVVYLADQQIDQVFQLYQVLFSTPQTSTLLNPPLAAGKTVKQYDLTSDSTKVVYIADQDTATVDELYAVLFSNPGSSTKLNNPLVAGRDVTNFVIAPNGFAVVYRADQRVDEIFEIFLASVAGPGSVTNLNPDLLPGRNVTTTFAVTPDSTAVIYLADQSTTGVIELYRVLFSAPQTSSVKLNGLVAAGGNVSGFDIAPNGSVVAYRADQRLLGVQELFSVALSTPPGASQQLNINLIGGQNVTGFTITPDSTAVIYMANQTNNASIQLYQVAFSAPQQPNPPVVLNGPITPGGNVRSFAVTPTSTFVIYLADQTTFGTTELYSVNVGAPGQSTRLNGLLTPGGNVTAFTF